jgi:hypothetical protein
MKVHGSYEQAGYAHIEQLVPAEVAQALVGTMERDLKAGGLSFSSFETSGPLMRKSAIEIPGHSYTPLISFLWGLTPIMCQLTGRDLLPSYDYFRIYQAGDILRPHSDRPACEHSLSLTLAYSEGKPWEFDIDPRALQEPKGPSDSFDGEEYRTIVMTPGDAVLYRGVEHRHGRTRPNPNRWSMHLFLHWVEREGPHKDHAFDAVRIAEHAAALQAQSGQAP